MSRCVNGRKIVIWCSRPFLADATSEVPSWLLSDGTLRLMALTLIAFASLPEPRTYLVEEPENGLHPLAIQVVSDVLSQPPEGIQFWSPATRQSCFPRSLSTRLWFSGAWPKALLRSGTAERSRSSGSGPPKPKSPIFSCRASFP